MYTTKKHYAFNPRLIGGMIEDMFQNGWSKMAEETNDGGHVPVNIYETGNSYDLQVVAPGVAKEDIKINLDKNVLTISFEAKKDESTEEAGKWLRKEYRMRSFKRSFTLNDKIDASGISAKYADGILNIALPKKENAVQPTLEIAVA